MVELKRSTLSIYRCVWEAHCEQRLAGLPLREIDAGASSRSVASCSRPALA